MSTEDPNSDHGSAVPNARQPRRVARSSRAIPTSDGAGVALARVFPTMGSMAETDPFLLMDELGPTEYGPYEMPGFPDHPHRGFETVTYVLEGMLQHRDSTGGGGIIGPGDTQWMTAGSGLVHSEMPAGEFNEAGGISHGFQLWVNLPAAKKMVPPRYQDLKAQHIPVVELHDGSKIRVIAGEVAGVQGPGATHTPIVYAHISLGANSQLELDWVPSFVAFAYVFAGGLTIPNTGPGESPGLQMEYGAQTLLQLVRGEYLGFQAGPHGAEVMVMGGAPIREPIAHWGPFVMNTQEEILQAVQDYEAGKLGVIVG